MITLLQNTGYAALQSATPSSKLRFTGFSVGDAVAVPPAINYTAAQGNTVYVGAAADMRYIPFHSGALVLQLIIPANKPFMRISNIMLYVNSSIPFCLCISERTFIKTATISDSTGVRFMFQLELRLPNILNFIDMSNLSQNLADIFVVENEAALNASYVPLEGRDQGILKHHAKLNRGVPLLFINNELWGCPLMMDVADPDYFLIDGGVIGDKYEYDFDYSDLFTVWDDTKIWDDTKFWTE